MSKATHYDERVLYLEDCAETSEPWLRWECAPDGTEYWNQLKEDPSWHPNVQYRRIRKTHTVNGFEVAAPYDAPPSIGKEYHFCGAYHVASCNWKNDATDLRFLALGNCFKTKDDGQENFDAIWRQGEIFGGVSV